MSWDRHEIAPDNYYYRAPSLSSEFGVASERRLRSFQAKDTAPIGWHPAVDRS